MGWRGGGWQEGKREKNLHGIQKGCTFIDSKKESYGGVRHHKQRIDMETTRQNKISRLIEKELGDIFLKYAKTLGGVMLTVTKVNISPDLSIAHVNISIFPSEKQESVMEQIKKNDKNIRFELGTAYVINCASSLNFISTLTIRWTICNTSTNC